MTNYADERNILVTNMYEDHLIDETEKFFEPISGWFTFINY